MVACWVVCFGHSEYVVVTGMSVHTLWMVFLLAAVLDCTQCLGTWERPLPLRSLQFLGLPVSSIDDWLPSPSVCRVLWCYRSFFLTVLVSVAWMIDSSLYWPLKSCAVACYIASLCFGHWSIPLVGQLDQIEYYEWVFFFFYVTHKHL